MPDPNRLIKAEQWVIAPDGSRWKVISIGPLVVELEDESGEPARIAKFLMRDWIDEASARA